MANDFSGVVWYIDTPYASAPAGDIRNSQVYIKSINWSGMNNGDSVKITDRNGKVLYQYTANEANENINLPRLDWQPGLLVPVIQSGNLQIAVGK